jgi:hypothetical protein
MQADRPESAPSRHPEEFRDTDPRAMEVWLDLQRNMPRGEKLAAVLSASQFVLQMYEMGVRRLHPDADDREVLLRVAARHLPRQSMIDAYGWDPEEHGEPG